MTFCRSVTVAVILALFLSAADQFEVASIRPCSPDAVVRVSRGGGGSSGLLRTQCQTVRDLVLTAYGAYATGHKNPPPLPPVEGGPKWIDTERYTIEAKAQGNPGGGMMQGPMLQTLLEDRFQLKIRRELRDGPAYALMLANRGPKLQPHQEGSCINPGSPPQHVPGERPAICGFNRPGGKKGPNVVLDVPGVTVDYFARTFLGIAFPDRAIIDRTGVTGLFDIRLEFAADSASNVDGDVGPSIFTALQEQLGLRLAPSRGAREFVVIERVEHPSEN